MSRRLDRHAAEAPGVYEAVTRQMVEDAIEGQRELRKLLYAVFGSVIVAGVVALALGALR